VVSHAFRGGKVFTKEKEKQLRSCKKNNPGKGKGERGHFGVQKGEVKKFLPSACDEQGEIPVVDDEKRRKRS